MECAKCVCVWFGAGVGGEGGDWKRGLGLDFTNPVETAAAGELWKWK